MTDTAANAADPFKAIEAIGDVKVAPAHGIAAVALSLAMKYHDTTIIKDGAMYQQYKLEGRNLRELTLDTVFETAIRIELHLLGSSERIAKTIVEALEVGLDDREAFNEVITTGMDEAVEKGDAGPGAGEVTRE